MEIPGFKEPGVSQQESLGGSRGIPEVKNEAIYGLCTPRVWSGDTSHVTTFHRQNVLPFTLGDSLRR